MGIDSAPRVADPSPSTLPAPMLRLARLAPALALLLTACDTTGDGIITRYDGPPLTAADATVPNPPFADARWEGTRFLLRRDRDVFLGRSTLCGDECSRTVTLRFEEALSARAGDLPLSVEAAVDVSQGNPDGFERTPFTVHRVEIQDWGPEVYSGVAYASGDGAPSERIVFWAEDLATAVE